VGNHEFASPALPHPKGYIMKLTMAENIGPSGGKNEDIVFGRRLIELGLFKDETKLPTGFGLRLRRGSGDHIIRNWVVQYRQHGRTRRMFSRDRGGDSGACEGPEAPRGGRAWWRSTN